MPAWFEPLALVLPAVREDCIDLIMSDLSAYMTTDPDGRASFDIDGFMVLASQRLAAIPDPNPPFFYNSPELIRGANVRPLVEGFKAEIAALVSVSDSQGTVDIAPMLADIKAKSEAVTNYFDRLYTVDLANMLVLWQSNGVLETLVPEADDLSKETRYYRTTFVNDWENESAPSEVSDAVDVGLKDTVTIDRGTVPSGRNIAHWRPYRSNSGSETATFQYVPSTDDLGVPIATATLEDEVPNSELQEVCPSTIWAEPPANLNGIVAMANGIHLGFFGRTLCPSESYVPYAYPVEYQLTVESDIVGLCAWDQSAFVGTTGSPYFVSGVDAATLTATKLDGDQACVSARSICATKRGVVYASPDGLCLAVPGSPVEVITQRHFTREEWQALNPETLIVREHDGVLYFGRFDPLVDQLYVWTHFTPGGGRSLNDNNTIYSHNTSVSGSGTPTGVRTNAILAGKVYCEFRCTARPGSMPIAFGITSNSNPTAFYSSGNYAMFSGAGQCFQPSSGLSEDGSLSGSGAYAFGLDDTIGVAFDAATGKAWFSRNGTWIQGDPAAGTNPSLTVTPGTWWFYGSTYSCNTASGVCSLLLDPICLTYGPPSGFTSYQP